MKKVGKLIKIIWCEKSFCRIFFPKWKQQPRNPFDSIRRWRFNRRRQRRRSDAILIHKSSIFAIIVMIRVAASNTNFHRAIQKIIGHYSLLYVWPTKCKLSECLLFLSSEECRIIFCDVTKLEAYHFKLISELFSATVMRLSLGDNIEWLYETSTEEQLNGSAARRQNLLILSM